MQTDSNSNSRQRNGANARRITIAALTFIILVAALLFILKLMSNDSVQERIEGDMIIRHATVESICDGDTCWVKLDDGGEEKVRFTGVNTPELDGEQAQEAEEAKEFTERKIDGKEVWLMSETESERDKYDRLLAYVWLSDPSNYDDWSDAVISETLNGILISQGYAEPMTIEPNTTFANEFESAYEELQ